MGECETASVWFGNLGKDVEERMSKYWSDVLIEENEKVLTKLWREKDRRKKRGRCGKGRRNKTD